MTEINITLTDNNTGLEVLTKSFEHEIPNVDEIPSEDNALNELGLDKVLVQHLDDASVYNTHNSLPVALRVDIEDEQYAAWTWQGLLNKDFSDGEWTIVEHPEL